MPPNDWENSLTLRRYTDSDIPFMGKLYASTRYDELAVTHFSEEQKQQFINQQFGAQLLHYTQYYNSDAFNIIELRGEAIGRFFVDFWDDQIRVVDIAIANRYRNLGIGSFLFERLFAQARQKNIPVTIHVERNNPAKGLYERLGFRAKSETNEIYLLMEWLPDHGN